MAVDFEQLRSLQNKSQSGQTDPWARMMYQMFLKSHGMSLRNAIGVSDGGVATGIYKGSNKYSRPVTSGLSTSINDQTPQGVPTAGTHGLGMLIDDIEKKEHPNEIGKSALATHETTDEKLEQLLNDKTILPKLMELVKKKMTESEGIQNGNQINT
jgi:hypothetical protein